MSKIDFSRESIKNDKSTRLALYCLITMVSGVAMLVLSGNLLNRSFMPRAVVLVGIYFGLVSLTASVVILLVGVIREQREERQKRLERLMEEGIKNEEAINAYKTKIASLEQDKASQAKEIQRLEAFLAKDMIRTMQKENVANASKYFRISINHAKFSFAFSIFACLVGIALLGVAVYYAIADRSLQTTLIPTIGATVAEFIAATVFWVHRRSAEQLNRYYDSLHEIEVFLSTIDVIEQIADPDKQDAAYQRVLDELFAIQKIKAEKEINAKRR